MVECSINTCENEATGVVKGYKVCDECSHIASAAGSESDFKSFESYNGPYDIEQVHKDVKLLLEAFKYSTDSSRHLIGCSVSFHTGEGCICGLIEHIERFNKRMEDFK